MDTFPRGDRFSPPPPVGRETDGGEFRSPLLVQWRALSRWRGLRALSALILAGIVRRAGGRAAAAAKPPSELGVIQCRIGAISVANLSQVPFKRPLVASPGTDSGRSVSGRRARFCGRRETVPIIVNRCIGVVYIYSAQPNSNDRTVCSVNF